MLLFQTNGSIGQFRQSILSPYSAGFSPAFFYQESKWINPGS
jgi:hypothetical protein